MGWVQPECPKKMECMKCGKMTDGHWVYFNNNRWWFTCKLCAKKELKSYSYAQKGVSND